MMEHDKRPQIVVNVACTNEIGDAKDGQQSSRKEDVALVHKAYDTNRCHYRSDASLDFVCNPAFVGISIAMRHFDK